MGFSAGDNTVRVLGLRIGVQGIYDVHQFTLVNLSNEVHDIAYATPAGTVPVRLVRDLMALQKNHLWVTMYLKEVNRRLAIVTIKEPKQPQDELWALFNRRNKVRLN